MNNPNNRAIRAIVASGSLLAIIFIGAPWVDEYLRLRRDAMELRQLKAEFAKSQQRRIRVSRIEAKLRNELESLLARSTDPTDRESVREKIIKFVRQSGGRIRRLEIAEGESRVWAVEQDHPRLGTMPIYGQESRFVLHTHEVELQAEGSLESIRKVLSCVTNHGWLMTTKGLTMVPTGLRESPVNLEIRLVLYGLEPAKNGPKEEFATMDDYRTIAIR